MSYIFVYPEVKIHRNEAECDLCGLSFTHELAIPGPEPQD